MEYNKNSIDDLLLQYGLSPAELAARIGASRQRVCYWRDNKISIEGICLICSEFDITPGFFFDED